jgi:tetratricopeptide (TPR) repeat protein
MNCQQKAIALAESSTHEEAAGVLDSIDADESIAVAQELKEFCYSSWSTEPIAARQASAALDALNTLFPTPEIRGIAAWIRGIADITEGGFENAIGNLARAHDLFVSIDKPREAAETQVAKLIPLGLTGQYEKAIHVGKSALSVFENLKDDIAAGKIEINLSNIAARQGRYFEAKTFGISAVNRFTSAADTHWQVIAENDLANTLAELNQFDEAEQLYKRALKTADTQEMHLTKAELTASLGNLQTFRGQYGPAIKSLEESRRGFEQLSMPHEKVIAELEIAEIYQILNLTKEAKEIYERIPAQLRDFKMRGEEARSHTNYGKLALETGDLDVAGKELNSAAELYRHEKNPSGLAKVQLWLGKLELICGRYENALSFVEASTKLIEEKQSPRLYLEASLLCGETLRRLGRIDDASKALKKSADIGIKTEQIDIAISSLVGLAKISIATNSTVDAQSYLKKAIDLVEALRSPIPAEEFRMTFLANKLEPFELSARLHLTNDDVEEAFVWTERARSRTLFELLNSGPTVGTDADADESEFIKQRERLNWCYSRISRGLSNEADDRKEIEKLEKSLATKRLRGASVGGANDAVNYEMDWDGFTKGLALNLGDERCLIEFSRIDGQYSAFIVDSDGIEHLDSIASEAQVLECLEELRFQFETLRFDADRLERFRDQLIQRTNQCLEELYELLVMPFEDRIKDKHLVIVPVGSLFYIPFGALFDGDSYLVEKRRIVLSPSAAIWHKSKTDIRREVTEAGIFAFAGNDIPYVEDEAAAVKSELRHGRIFSGESATVKNYFETSPDFDVIHLACHGEFRSDSPMYSNLRLSDGFLTVSDISRQSLKASLVTLSACETGLNEIFAGEEILGLARGFLSAGAANILMTLWTVNDASTKELMSCFYSYLATGTSVSEALRRAQTKLIDQKAHPYYWAPFAMIGE